MSPDIQADEKISTCRSNGGKDTYATCNVITRHGKKFCIQGSFGGQNFNPYRTNVENRVSS